MPSPISAFPPSPFPSQRLAPSPLSLCLRIARSDEQLCQRHPRRLHRFVPQPPTHLDERQSPSLRCSMVGRSRSTRKPVQSGGIPCPSGPARMAQGQAGTPNLHGDRVGLLGATPLLRTTLPRPGAVRRRRRGDEFDLQPLQGPGPPRPSPPGLQPPVPSLCVSEAAWDRGTGPPSHPHEAHRATLSRGSCTAPLAPAETASPAVRHNEK